MSSLQTERLKSLDVFRGMTVAFMILVNTPGSWSHLFSPLAHADWHGYTPTDLVFPFFLIAVGLSMSFSFKKYSTQPAKEFYIKVFKRTILIFLIGMAMRAFPFTNVNWAEFRILGVLQRIALAYFFASIIIRNITSIKSLLISSGIILFGYWALLLLFSTGNDPYGLENNAVLRFDLWLLGGDHLWHGKGIPFDPEGFLSTLPSVASVIAGYLFGKLIQSKKQIDLVATLFLIGNLLVITGYAWDLVFPINKSLWTSSFVLVTSGLGAVLMAFLIYIIDIKHKDKWIEPFLVFGKNTLFIYVLSIIWVKTYFQFHIGDQNIYSWLFSTVFQPIGSDKFGSFLFALTHVAGCWVVGYIMDKKKIYIKI
ncbi:MAG: DUF5009 domain-containing protein [Cyclobacteriaceae bacterium]|nr:DUF5009 domain-containing protein [Cyclobacteriaceae bacterium]